jgi:hAT family C-terminal dimerisation region
MRASCLELASFAERLIRITANSVVSERAWSAMNFIHSKSRNSLLVDTVDKLIFIYMNYRALRKLKEDELSDDELLAVEGRFMGWV